MSSQSSADISEFKKNASVHGLLESIAFLVILPVGVLIARYLRTFTNRWWYVHWIINFLVACPLILVAWAMGNAAHGNTGHAQTTPHGKVGYIVIWLYIGQLFLGLVIHYVKIPVPFLGHRPPQNFFHALLGLAILALANYQVYDGIYHKTAFLAADVRRTVEHTWLALIIAFWSLYAIGLIFLRRQYQQERKARGRKVQQKDQGTYNLSMRTARDFHIQDDFFKKSSVL